jgi:hypothetical protein
VWGMGKGMVGKSEPCITGPGRLPADLTLLACFSPSALGAPNILRAWWQFVHLRFICNSMDWLPNF